MFGAISRKDSLRASDQPRSSISESMFIELRSQAIFVIFFRLYKDICALCARAIADLTFAAYNEFYSVAAGYFSSAPAGRIARFSKLPPQFEHAPSWVFAAQSSQNVHSNQQMRASSESGGRGFSQVSHFAFKINILRVFRF